jgi:hypothetical protein
MKPVTYICENYPEFSIGPSKQREVKFHLGRFVATEKWQVTLIESNEWYGCFIFKAEPHTIQPIPAGGAIPIPRPERDGTAEPPVVKTGEPLDEEAHTAPESEAELETEKETEEAPVPEYIISDTAMEILSQAGVSCADAGKKLELDDGDRLTVKMAEGFING